MDKMYTSSKFYNNTKTTNKIILSFINLSHPVGILVESDECDKAVFHSLFAQFLVKNPQISHHLWSHSKKHQIFWIDLYQRIPHQIPFEITLEET